MRKTKRSAKVNDSGNTGRWRDRPRRRRGDGSLMVVVAGAEGMGEKRDGEKRERCARGTPMRQCKKRMKNAPVATGTPLALFVERQDVLFIEGAH